MAVVPDNGKLLSPQAAVTAGDRGAAGPAASPGSGGRHGWLPATFLPGMVIYADSSAGSTGPQLLYQAIGAGNLRPYVQGQDDRGGAALSNHLSTGPGSCLVKDVQGHLEGSRAVLPEGGDVRDQRLAVGGIDRAGWVVPLLVLRELLGVAGQLVAVVVLQVQLRAAEDGGVLTAAKPCRRLSRRATIRKAPWAVRWAQIDAEYEWAWSVPFSVPRCAQMIHFCAVVDAPGVAGLGCMLGEPGVPGGASAPAAGPPGVLAAGCQPGGSQRAGARCSGGVLAVRARQVTGVP